jgi:hypothetical protein
VHVQQNFYIAGGYIFIRLHVRFMLFLVQSLYDCLNIPVCCQKPFVPQVYEFMNKFCSHSDCCASFVLAFADCLCELLHDQLPSGLLHFMHITILSGLQFLIVIYLQ